MAGRSDWTPSRRSVVAGGAALAALKPLRSAAAQAPARVAPAPITPQERRDRIAKLQSLLSQRRLSALVLETGSSLRYFTGVSWSRSERITAAVIPASGPVVVVTPAFEAPSVRESLAVEADVRVWNEADSPFALLADALQAQGPGRAVAAEPTCRFFVLDGVRRLQSGIAFVSGADEVNACRMIKSAAELTLMQTANTITLEALRRVRRGLALGMTARAIAARMDQATLELGGEPEFSLVLLNEASAYPHGSHRAEAVRDGSVILMDCGCSVEGYQSDISRTFVFGAPSARQRSVWETVRQGQTLALEAAGLGRPVGEIDDAVRRFYEGRGFGPGYRLPGLNHRTGHGIGLDGHEAPYLVHGDATLLQSGMCFSDEPGLYCPGEFGVRLEDCWRMSETGPQLFTPLARSLDDPI